MFCDLEDKCGERLGTISLSLGTALEKSPKASQAFSEPQASQNRPQLPGNGLFGKGFSLLGLGRRDQVCFFLLLMQVL